MGCPDRQPMRPPGALPSIPSKQTGHVVGMMHPAFEEELPPVAASEGAIACLCRVPPRRIIPARPSSLAATASRKLFFVASSRTDPRERSSSAIASPVAEGADSLFKTLSATRLRVEISRFSEGGSRGDGWSPEGGPVSSSFAGKAGALHLSTAARSNSETRRHASQTPAAAVSSSRRSSRLQLEQFLFSFSFAGSYRLRGAHTSCRSSGGFPDLSVRRKARK
jgi:hypothetical protein